MKKKINVLAIIVSLIILIIGITGVLIEVIMVKNTQNFFINVGCSMIASGIVLLLSTIFLDYKKEYEVKNVWGLEKIYKTRAEKNIDADTKFEKYNIKQLDGIAFGLRSFRTQRKDVILNCLNNGMNVRLLVMNPDSPFMEQREKEEGVQIGSIADSIRELVKWVSELNFASIHGKIEIRFYNCMTLDFYWRMDDELYIGPYNLQCESQQTITYKFSKGKKGFEYYEKYFEELWNNEKFVQK